MKELGIIWNLLTAYHLQTDGLSERKNQWFEQFLHLIGAYQNEWSTMLPLATLVHNNTQNSTTCFPLNQPISGLELMTTADQSEGSGNPLVKQ